MAAPLHARILIDHLGRKVILPDKIERIVSLAPSVTELIFALGGGDRVKGATLYSDYPPAAAVLPKVGSYVHPDLERIMALEPDVCIGVKDGNPKIAVDRLEGLGIPVFAVNPVSLSTVMQSVELIAEVLEAPEAGNELTRSMKSRINAVDRLVAGADTRPGVFFQIGLSPIVSVGTDTFLNELIERAGGRNLTAGSTPYPRFSKEQVLSLRPDVIIVTSMAKGSPGVAEKTISGWKEWPSLPAVAADRVMMINSDVIDRPGPRMVTGLETLMRLIHPELPEALP